MLLKVTLQPGRDKSVLSGHPWIFSRAIAVVSEAVIPGAMVGVFSNGGRFLARGYYNPASQIAVRILSYDENEAIDVPFFVRKFQQALELRKSFLNFKDINAYRLVNSEGDFLPGLIVDVYADFVVVQFHTMGMEVFRQEVMEALVEVLKPKGIFERSDLSVRKQEGVETKPVGVLYGENPPEGIEVMEHGVKFFVDIVKGQKTGFFLDQRENRQTVGKFVEGMVRQAHHDTDVRVLNLFSYTGGFSLYAAKCGAAAVTTVDASESAIAMARKNFVLNGFESGVHEFVTGDVFDVLPKYKKEDRKFDVVIVDPPSFGKRRDDLKNALMAYTNVNRQAMELIPSGGILVAASCTHYVTPEMFWDCLRGAASFAKRKLQILEVHGQPLDHPMSAHFPEGQYLKCYVCRVI